MLQAIRPALFCLEVADDAVGRLLLPGLQKLCAKVGDVAEVPVEAAARHFQPVGHRPDLQGVGAFLGQCAEPVADPVGLGEAIGHGLDHTHVY